MFDGFVCLYSLRYWTSNLPKQAWISSIDQVVKPESAALPRRPTLTGIDARGSGNSLSKQSILIRYILVHFSSDISNFLISFGDNR